MTSDTNNSGQSVIDRIEFLDNVLSEALMRASQTDAVTLALHELTAFVEVSLQSMGPIDLDAEEKVKLAELRDKVTELEHTITDRQRILTAFACQLKELADV